MYYCSSKYHGHNDYIPSQIVKILISTILWLIMSHMIWIGARTISHFVFRLNLEIYMRQLIIILFTPSIPSLISTKADDKRHHFTLIFEIITPPIHRELVRLYFQQETTIVSRRVALSLYSNDSFY